MLKKAFSLLFLLPILIFAPFGIDVISAYILPQNLASELSDFIDNNYVLTIAFMFILIFSFFVMKEISAKRSAEAEDPQFKTKNVYFKTYKLLYIIYSSLAVIGLLFIIYFGMALSGVFR